MKITPEDAAQLVGAFENYEGLDIWLVYYYCSTLKRGGEWPNRDPIKIGDGGIVHNGRHRLLAAVIANKDLECEVEYC